MRECYWHTWAVPGNDTIALCRAMIDTISLIGAALPCRGCVPSHGDIAVTIVPFVRLWPDADAPATSQASPLTEVDLSCRRSQWHGSF